MPVSQYLSSRDISGIVGIVTLTGVFVVQGWWLALVVIGVSASARCMWLERKGR